jgi:hypothetical protein
MVKQRKQQDKLNAFGDTLEHIFTTNPDVDNSFTVGTEQTVNDFLKQPMKDRVTPTNHSEISWIVRHLKPRKSKWVWRITKYNSVTYTEFSLQIYCQNI